VSIPDYLDTLPLLREADILSILPKYENSLKVAIGLKTPTIEDFDVVEIASQSPPRALIRSILFVDIAAS
jgi:hypothetical protein